jgi:CheY-like chemotaxis protein
MIDDYKEKVLKAGFQGYISKPYKAEELLLLIQNLTSLK